MVTTAGDSIFIDTNVLVFASLPNASMHKASVAAFHEISRSNTKSWISRQILREYLVQITRPGVMPGGTPASAAAQVTAMSSLFRIADETPSTTAVLLHLIQAFGISGKAVHDANIVATMQVNGIQRLLTHNVADFKRYASLITVVPLLP